MNAVDTVPILETLNAKRPGPLPDDRPRSGRPAADLPQHGRRQPDRRLGRRGRPRRRRAGSIRCPASSVPARPRRPPCMPGSGTSSPISSTPKAAGRSASTSRPRRRFSISPSASAAILAPGANLVVTDLDHMANVSPWETVFGEGLGREVRRARVTAEGTLDVAHLLSVVDARTGLVGRDLARRTAPARVVRLRGGRLRGPPRRPRDVWSRSTPSTTPRTAPLDVRESDVDFLVFSGYKVFGPMLGVLWGRAEHLERLRPYRVETNKPVLPGKLEMGMLNNAALAALEAALYYLLWLGELAAGPGPPPRTGPRCSAR
ncbi:MAG: aminotransferase class V-fold PLP-dependent enzyme [Candidatus Moduliflexus flocculans]|nr:aminotransferase class V-fold PLP-dependent enzyme [Candidatus Moduliflexus flocculans]